MKGKKLASLAGVSVGIVVHDDKTIKSVLLYRNRFKKKFETIINLGNW